MNQPEITPGLLSLLPSFSALQAPVSQSEDATEGLFDSVLSELLPVENASDELLPHGENLPLSGQALSPQVVEIDESLPDEYQPQRLLEQIRQAQHIRESAPAAVDTNATVSARALVGRPVNEQQTTDILLPDEQNIIDVDYIEQAQVVGQSQATVIAKPILNQTSAERTETTASAAMPDPLAPVASNATDGQVLARSDQFASSDDALVTDAELQQLEEQQQQMDSKERLDFGRDKQQWTPAMGSRIITMVAENIQQAEIHLDPPELGSLEIKLQINQEQANVQVQVQNPQVKEVLEANAQRLKNELAEQGIELAGFDVSQQQQGGQSGDSSGGSADGSSQSGEWLTDTTEEANQEAVKVTSHNGVLDAYA